MIDDVHLLFRDLFRAADKPHPPAHDVWMPSCSSLRGCHACDIHHL
jgi:hypothetical protein